ncbi:hypothetical protein PMm318_A37500 [Pseudomonas moorei]
MKLSGKKRGRVIGIIRFCQEGIGDSNPLMDYRLTLTSQPVSAKGHATGPGRFISGVSPPDGAMHQETAPDH